MPKCASEEETKTTVHFVYIAFKIYYFLDKLKRRNIGWIIMCVDDNQEKQKYVLGFCGAFSKRCTETLMLFLESIICMARTSRKSRIKDEGWIID